MHSTHQVTAKSLNELKNAIESLTPQQQVEILRILNDRTVKITSSKAGICFNLTHLSDEILEELSGKVAFIQDREKTLTEFEKKTEECYKSISTGAVDA
jgi:hypothetical protein